MRIVRGQNVLKVEYKRRQRELAEAKKKNKLTEYLKIQKDEVNARAVVSCCSRVLCRSSIYAHDCSAWLRFRSLET